MPKLITKNNDVVMDDRGGRIFAILRNSAIYRLPQRLRENNDSEARYFSAMKRSWFQCSRNREHDYEAYTAPLAVMMCDNNS